MVKEEEVIKDKIEYIKVDEVKKIVVGYWEREGGKKRGEKKKVKENWI